MDWGWGRCGRDNNHSKGQLFRPYLRQELRPNEILTIGRNALNRDAPAIAAERNDYRSCGLPAMQHICPKDSDVSAYMGHKLKICRAGEEFIGVVTGWADVDGARPWMLVADNASMTFLPSEGWDVHDCTAEKAALKGP